MASRNREISNWIPRRKTGNATGTVPTRGLTASSCTSPARPAVGNGSPAMPGMNAFLWLSFPPLRWRGQEHPLPAAPPVRHCRHSGLLASMAPEFLETLLQSAAAYRFRNKHRRHAERAKYAGEEQALFENLAETLGYHANKTAMRHLALRAPLRSIRNCPEALLFGTAGFLLPVLPASCTPEAVELHKKLWAQWWPLRAQFEIGRASCRERV